MSAANSIPNARRLTTKSIMTCVAETAATVFISASTPVLRQAEVFKKKGWSFWGVHVSRTSGLRRVGKPQIVLVRVLAILVAFELLSKLLVSPLVTPIVVPYIIPYATTLSGV